MAPPSQTRVQGDALPAGAGQTEPNPNRRKVRGRNRITGNRNARLRSPAASPRGSRLPAMPERSRKWADTTPAPRFLHAANRKSPAVTSGAYPMLASSGIDRSFCGSNRSRIAFKG